MILIKVTEISLLLLLFVEEAVLDILSYKYIHWPYEKNGYIAPLRNLIPLTSQLLHM
ncbi:hypothetical protein PCURB6_33660 [Paenibacillus curdlanolyticus]|nr:hypothetical protein PCURB6_33660 [Paenibacillus curdlanolyticus]